MNQHKSMWSGLRITGSTDMRARTREIMTDPSSASEADVAWLAAKSIALERLVQVWADAKPDTTIVMLSIGGPGGHIMSYTAPQMDMEGLTELMTDVTTRALAAVDVMADELRQGVEE